VAATGPTTFAEGLNLPGARPSVKDNFCRGLVFAESLALGKDRLAGCFCLPGVSWPNPQQRNPLPGA